MRTICLGAILFFSSLWSIAQEEATTSTGQKVLLNPDGTWKYISVDTLQSTSNYGTLELPKSRPGDVIIAHTAYTVSYNTNFKVANWVAYELTDNETIPVVKRNDNFVPDPLLKSATASIADYKDSDYDRGHLAPAADMCFSYPAMVESFFLTNIAPQNKSFNRGIWAKLEKQVRQWAVDDKVVYVVTGPLVSKGDLAIGVNKVKVPHSFYKIILDYKDPEIKGIAFILANQASKEPLQNYAVTIDSVEKLTGIDFFYQTPENQQRVFESVIDFNKWSWSSTSTDGNSEKASTSVQCQGNTKAGDQCKNKTLNPNSYCHLHQSQVPGSAKPENNIKNSGSRRSASVRCSGTTKKGTQCLHKTYSPNGRCWQHGGD